MKKIEDINILVIGDLMQDLYVIGSVNRISQESPFPILDVEEEYSTLGGCGNVINNLREIGANVSCISRIGNDLEGKDITKKLKELNVKTNLIIDERVPTIQKKRVIEKKHGVQMLRIDREKIVSSKYETINIIEECIKNNNHDVIVISDYAKGMITKDIMDYLSTIDIKVIVDPKPKNIELYKNVFMLTPNNKEYWEMKDYFHDACPDKICEYILHTKGKDGMTLYDNKVLGPFMNGKEIKSNPVKVFNVTGAGDTVVAVMAICISLDIEPLTSARIANECAAYVVTQPGTSTIPKKLFDEIKTKILLK